MTEPTVEQLEQLLEHLNCQASAYFDDYHIRAKALAEYIKEETSDTTVLWLKAVDYRAMARSTKNQLDARK